MKFLKTYWLAIGITITIAITGYLEFKLYQRNQINEQRIKEIDSIIKSKSIEITKGNY